MSYKSRSNYPTGGVSITQERWDDIFNIGGKVKNYNSRNGTEYVFTQNNGRMYLTISEAFSSFVFSTEMSEEDRKKLIEILETGAKED